VEAAIDTAGGFRIWRALEAPTRLFVLTFWAFRVEDVDQTRAKRGWRVSRSRDAF